MPHRNRLLPLTGLRFFLAISVVIYHQTSPDNYLGPVTPRLPDILFAISRTGYVAVDVFFVLSGFVLSYFYSLATRFSSSQLVSFAINRFARIYPTYCLGLLLIAPFIVAQVFRNGSVGFAAREGVSSVCLKSKKHLALRMFRPYN
jgi:peptidoglycan/LPS O-acetylase OafA/YrhL